MFDLMRIPIERRTAAVFVNGWQSWSPSTTYGVDDPPHRPTNARTHTLGYRPDVEVASEGFQAEGLLAVQAATDAPVHIVAATGPTSVPTIRAHVDGDALVLRTSGDVEHLSDDGPGGIDGALARWADAFAARCGVETTRPAPTTWCSWYHYFTKVTEQDVLENLDAVRRLDLPVDVIQLDDGYQEEIGDWLTLSERFVSVERMAARIRDSGLEAGIWTAPFLVGARSAVAAEHPDWLVGGPDEPVHAGENWDQDLYALDVTHPSAAAWLERVYRTMQDWGISFHKIDFVYAGALPGRRHDDVSPLEAYRRGIALLRGAIGDAYLLGCGAPLLPSVGLVDAMRVSPDTAPDLEPRDGDVSQPAIRSAMMTGRARAFMHGRLWINDPDCLLARPAVELRHEWAQHVERWGGLRSSSDRIADLDDWGLETTRRILSTPPPPRFIHS